MTNPRMTNSTTAVEPLYQVGDRVFHQNDLSAPGIIKSIEAHTAYTYVVEWDDNDPTDSYPEDVLLLD